MPLLRLLLFVIALPLAASPAAANWLESGFVDIVANLASAEAADIEPGDVVDSVQVGSATESGEVTVVGEGDVTTRQSLGQWTVENGQGNIQSTFGAGGPFRAETGNFPVLRDGVIDVLNSDVAGNFRAGERGTVRLTASVIDDLTVADGGSAYLSMGSRAEILTTELGGAYVRIDESSIVGNGVGTCYLDEATIEVRSALFACANVNLGRATDMDVFQDLGPLPELRVAQALAIGGSTLDVNAGIASTGSVALAPTAAGPTALIVAGTSWVNAGTVDLATSAALGSAEWVISGGSRFVSQGRVKVRSQPGVSGLVVTGAGTELEVESDLLVGQAVPGVPQPTVPGTMTVGDGADVIVHGTLVIGPLAVLNLNAGGTVYAGATEIHGTVNENGGTLVLPEPAGAAAGAIAAFALGFEARRRRVR